MKFSTFGFSIFFDFLTQVSEFKFLIPRMPSFVIRVVGNGSWKEHEVGMKLESRGWKVKLNLEGKLI